MTWIFIQRDKEPSTFSKLYFTKKRIWISSFPWFLVQLNVNKKGAVGGGNTKGQVLL